MASERLHESVIEYVRSNRVPSTIFEIAADLAMLGEYGADWPRASAQAWKRELEQAIGDECLRLDDCGCVRLPAAASGNVQMNLF